MATITLTQILGTDNVAQSRPVINQNFSTLENAINTLETFLNTTPAGGDLQVGNIKIKIGANTINDILFNNEASGLIQGNLTINQDLILTSGNLSVAGNITLANGLILNGTGPSADFTVGSTTNPVDVYFVNGMFVDSQYASTTAVSAHLETTSSSGIYDLDITDKRVIYLDYSLYTGGSGQADTFQLIGIPVLGQKIFIRITDAPASGGTFKLKNTGFNPIYTSDIEFTGTSDTQLKRLWLEIVYRASGWEVINAHPNVVNI